MNGDLTETYKMRDAYKKRKELVRELLAAIPGVKVNDPQGAFYIFPDASAYMKNSQISNSVDLSEHLLTEALVAVVPGKAFGNDDCFRISFAASETELSEGIRRISEALSRLKGS